MMLPHCRECGRHIQVYRTDVPESEQRIVWHKREFKVTDELPDGRIRTYLKNFRCSGSKRPPVYLVPEGQLSDPTEFNHVEPPPPAPELPMRLRVLHLPRDQFVIVIDRMNEELFHAEEGQDQLRAIGDHSKESLAGCGGILAFTDAVDMEAWYPYG